MGKADELLPLTQLQLKEQLDTIVDFLSAVHPTLLLQDGYKPCIEIRPIHRSEKKEYILNRSLNLWDLSPESLKRLESFLTRHNGKPTCIYYSVFTFDNTKEAVTADGKKAKTGKITKSSALATDEIALDFDNISYDEFVQIRQRFEAMGIFAIWVFSGHGYQCHILLDKSLSDKNILKNAVYKFRSKGFACDDACIDPARVMRLPGTFNCKCAVKEEYDELEPPRCDIVAHSATRYSLDKIFSELDNLPTVNQGDEQAYHASNSGKATGSKASKTSKTGKGTKTAKTGKSVKTPTGTSDDDLVKFTRIEYPHLSKFDVPEAVCRMLAFTPMGLRNKSLGFLLKFFKSYYRLSERASFDILNLWAKEACEPEYPEDEFKSDFKRLYGSGGLNYDSSLAKQFGIIDFPQLVELRKRDIMIPHKFFKDFKSLDGKVVRLYLAVKMLEHIDEPVTQEALTKLLKISDRALRPTLQDLCKSGHVYMNKGNSRQKIPNTYHSHRGYSAREGYVIFSYNDIRAYVKELYEDGTRGNGELKIFLFMRYKFANNEVFMSQTKLGENTGIARNTVSEIVYRLQSKHFLKISKIFHESFFESCVYTLLR